MGTSGKSLRVKYCRSPRFTDSLSAQKYYTEYNNTVRERGENELIEEANVQENKKAFLKSHLRIKEKQWRHEPAE